VRRRTVRGAILLATGYVLCFVRVPIGHIDGPTSNPIVTFDLWPLGALLVVFGGIALFDGRRRRDRT
jgi:hypothetical protein